MSHAISIGGTRGWVVSDGPLVLDPPGAIWPGSTLTRTVPLRAEQNCLLLDWSGLLPSGRPRGAVLVDAGLGHARLFGAESGRLADALTEVSVSPSDISAVLLTHAHSDHCWGLANADGTPAFPNATIHLARAEFEFWSRARSADGDWVRRHLSPIGDRLHLVEPGTTVLPGITALAATGHSPGHAIYRIEQGDDRLLVTGDLFLSATVSFAQPEAPNVYDMRPVAAAATRASVLTELARSGERLLGYHLAWPGLGRVRRIGDGFDFVPDAAA